MQKLAPVFDSDTRNAFKLAEIVCDDDQSAATGMASNHLVIRPDRCSLAGQFRHGFDRYVSLPVYRNPEPQGGR
ncbi:TrbH [Salmonella enterica subsp. enterica]|uniref:TrbH n=1 Tax=Salmonella enterica I TaxID=59201 RepID=A0A3S4JB25_SALET|nr:TrbH [Salmonella enterica subsp. enterica]